VRPNAPRFVFGEGPRRQGRMSERRFFVTGAFFVADAG
jgi:hypothetical protein